VSDKFVRDMDIGEVVNRASWLWPTACGREAWGLGMGMPTPGEMDTGLSLPREFGSGLKLSWFAGDGVADEMLVCLDRPGRPVSGFITSDTTDGRRRAFSVPLEFALEDRRGEGRAKLEGVRGRDKGAWSRIWSIMCSRTARWRLRTLREGVSKSAHLKMQDFGSETLLTGTFCTGSCAARALPSASAGSTRSAWRGISPFCPSVAPSRPHLPM
jgi:hypothetical protein